MENEDLAFSIIVECERVWGSIDGFDGSVAQYVWLNENYGITEEDDLMWQIVLELVVDGQVKDSLKNARRFKIQWQSLGSEPAVLNNFLRMLLARYRLGSA